MQTERKYYEVSSAPFDAYIIEARPAEKEGVFALILDKTIFYPEGGGQPADRGTINGMAVLDVQEKDGAILHSVSAATPPVPGPAKLILDAIRRRDITVQHTAQHLLSGTILRITGRPTVSMHLGDEVNTIDVDSPELSAETLLAVEEAAADAVEADCPVIIHLCPPEDIASFPLRKTPPQGEEVIRVVEIKNNDYSPCCGTHCSSTGQIGMLRILAAEKYKGKTRVSFIAGRRVLRDSRLLRENAAIASRALKVPVNETGQGVLALLEKTKNLEKRAGELAAAAAESKAGALARKAGTRTGGLVLESYAAEGIDELLLIGRAAQKQSQNVFLLASEKDLKFAAFCSEKSKDLRPLIQDAFEKHGGRGGGGPSFFQGQFASPVELAAFLAALTQGEERQNIDY
jgi:alanyl-tRNA synthetase